MAFRSALIEETAAFGNIIRTADLDTEIPTCPGWTLKQLLKHVGRGNRWCAQIVADHMKEPLDPREVRDGKPPEDLDGAIDWLNAGAQALIDAVEHVGSDAKVWTFMGPKPAGWWIRRRLHEQTVHRADAVLALGLPFIVDPELAADGVTETLERVVMMAAAADPPLERGRSLHLHAAESELGPTGEWLVVNDEDGLNWSHKHAKGDAAVRGPVSGLLLAVTRRQTVEEAGLEVLGDAAVWQRWVDHSAF